MNNFFQFYELIIAVVNRAIAVVISLAVLGFTWGIVKILFNPQNQDVRKEGKAYMLYGIITLFVMTSIWGIINILTATLAP